MTLFVGMGTRAAAVGLLALVLGALASTETAVAQQHALSPPTGASASGDESAAISFQVQVTGNLLTQRVYECRIDFAAGTAEAGDISGNTTVQVTFDPATYDGTEEETRHRCSFTVTDDEIVEEDETVVVKLYQQGQNAELAMATYTIEDVDETTVYITANNAEFHDYAQDTTSGIRVRITNAIEPTIRAHWYVTSDGDTDAADHGRRMEDGLPLGAVEFGPNAGANSFQRALLITDANAWDEDDEDFTVRLDKTASGTSIPDGIVDRVHFGDGTHAASITVTILADPQIVELNFAEATYQQDEGGTATVEVEFGRPILSTDMGELTFVIVATPMGGAVAGDFSAGSGLTEAPGTTNGYVVTAAAGTRPARGPATVSIDIARDDLWEFGEGVQLSFAASATQWNSDVFTAGTEQATTLIEFGESTDAPEIRLTASKIIMTEILGATESRIAYTVNSAGSRGDFPDNHNIVLSFDGAEKGADANSGDFRITRETLSGSGSNRTATLTVRDDSTVEAGGETLTISAHVTNGADVTATGISIPPIEITILDAMSITWNATSGTVAEADTGMSVPHVITITSNAPPAVDLSISLDIDTAASTASAADFTPVSFMLPADGSQLSPSVTLAVLNDDVAEIAEDLVLNLGGTFGDFPTAALPSESYTLTINDTVDTVAINLGNPRTQGSNFTFPVELSNGIGIDVRVPWSIALGGKITAADFESQVTSGHVDIDAGSDEATSNTFRITAANDGHNGEGAEEFTVTLGTPTTRADATPTALGNRLTLGAAPRSRGTIASDTNGITMTTFPARVMEGDGVVDVVIRALLTGNLFGSNNFPDLTVTLATSPSGGTANAQDFTVVGSVTGGGSTDEAASDSTLPELVIMRNTDQADGYLQLRVPKGEDDEPEETIAFSVTPSGQVLYSTSPGDLLIPIATAQFPPNETRIVQKQIRLGGDTTAVGWDFGSTNYSGTISSTSFMLDSVTYQLREVSRRVSDGRVTIVVSRRVPDEWYWRFTDGAGPTNLVTRTATTSEAVNSLMQDGEWRYRWDSSEDSSLTLPPLPADEWISLDILEVDEAAAFAAGASVENQTWHSGTAVELALPASVTGTVPITYSFVEPLPAGVALYTSAANVPSRITYTGAFPALLGTPTAAMLARPFTYRASDADGETADLSFNIGVTTGPPTNVVLTQLHLGFRVDWEAPVTSDPAIMITGYHIEAEGHETPGEWIPRTHDPGGTNTFLLWVRRFAATDIADGAYLNFRISAISNAGTSVPSAAVRGVVVLKPIDAIANLTARATGPQTVELSWTAPDINDSGTQINAYQVRRTTEANPEDDDWTLIATDADAGTPSYTDMSPTLRAGETYYYQVTSQDHQSLLAEWSDSAAVTTPAASPPPAPAAPTLTARRTGITITWAAPEFDGGSDILGYEVQAREGATGVPTVLKDDAADTYTTESATTYNHTGVTSGASVSYRVRAINRAGAGALSLPASATVPPAAPTPVISPIPEAVGRVFTITVTFNETVDDFDDEADITIAPADVATAAAPVSSQEPGERNQVFTVQITATRQTQLTITVPAEAARATVDRVNNVASNAATTTPDPIAPTILSVTSDAPDTVSGRFEITVVFSEAVYEFGADDFDCTGCVASPPIASSSARTDFTVGIVPSANGNLTVQVRAMAVRDRSGNRNQTASTDTLARTVADLMRPGSPTGLTATGGSRVNALRWTAPAGAGTTVIILGYRVQFYDMTQNDWADVVANTGNDATMYEHTGLLDGTTYRYRVYAIGGGGESEQPSNEARATTHVLSDANRDGRVTAGDGLLFLHVLQGLPHNTAVRRTLLAPYLSPGTDRTNHRAVDTAIEELVANRARFNLQDINGDGTANNVDALLLYHVRAFPELVGNGRSLPGFDRYRTILIAPYLDPMATGTEAEKVQLVIDRVYGRSP